MITYGHWQLLEDESAARGTPKKVVCRCVCGAERPVSLCNLKAGRTSSCGCTQRHPTKHGHSRGTQGSDPRGPTYNSWRGMLDRCRGPSSISYRNYGARGIAVCERWGDFRSFLADMGERPSLKHSLDRINNDLGYEAANCRWATAKEQSRNRRTNRFVTAFGKTLTLAEWADRSAIPMNRIAARLARGWDVERAVSTPTSGL